MSSACKLQNQVMRVGVVADTHCPEFLTELPACVFRALAGVDLILHAGDVNGQETLDRLGEIAPVRAVRGDHDRELALPRLLRLEIAGRQVALLHGNRSRLYEEPLTFLGTVTLGHLWLAPRLHEWLLSQAPAADVVVYGHTHAARARRLQGTLLFNPGAVYQVDRAAAEARLRRHPNWFEWTWLQFMRRRRRQLRPTVGILTFGPGGVDAEIVSI
jgi:putative phosphoesterase